MTTSQQTSGSSERCWFYRCERHAEKNTHPLSTEIYFGAHSVHLGRSPSASARALPNPRETRRAESRRQGRGLLRDMTEDDLPTLRMALADAERTRLRGNPFCAVAGCSRRPVPAHYRRAAPPSLAAPGGCSHRPARRGVHHAGTVPLPDVRCDWAVRAAVAVRAAAARPSRSAAVRLWQIPSVDGACLCE